ncbi:hypothetical protein PROFUN_16829 [Planoprotostelium fungivorum]|uniref:Uncharacterized protein n=1 Tax=Planoprotostelium fungivorum TaxID=1890364 RepID=A0A2P6MNQ8_9EUKA|nr:hypothetical protein PROFUN_16829 [Planoprotostelium fungivorum]
MAYIRENITSTPDYALETRASLSPMTLTSYVFLKMIDFLFIDFLLPQVVWGHSRETNQSLKEHIRRRMNKLSTEDWRRTQKQPDYKNYDRDNLDKQEKETIQPPEDDRCKFCSDIMEGSIIDSHQHVLGECILTRELNDQLWANLKQFWDKSKIQTENILPWFSTSDYVQYEWNLPKEMRNKGLIPRNLQRKISKENKGLNVNSIVLATIISAYLYRQALMET